MSIRKAFASVSFLVFPLALLIVYWEYTYFEGHPIEQALPSFAIFLGLAVLLLLEALFRNEQAVSQRRLLFGDIASTAVNVLYTCELRRRNRALGPTTQDLLLADERRRAPAAREIGRYLPKFSRLAK